MATVTVTKIHPDATESVFEFVNEMGARYNLVSCVLQDLKKMHPFGYKWIETFTEINSEVKKGNAFWMWREEEKNITYLTRIN